MSDREAFVRGYQAGHLLEAVRSAFSANRSERTKLASHLVALHNEGAIDLLETFGALTREELDFFPLRRIFEEALPDLKAPVPELIRTVVHLYREAGRDLAAGKILSAIEGFYSKSPDRPRAALAEIEANAEVLADLLITTLVAGSAEDPSFFVGEAVRLCGDANVEIRKRALYSLARLKGGPNHTKNGAIVRTLEHAVAAEEDEGVLASALSSAFELSRKSPAEQTQFFPIIAGALAKGGDTTLHAVAQIFGFQTRELSPELLELFLGRLAGVKPNRLDTLESIDYGIAHLLQSDSVEVGLGFLEKLLRIDPENLHFSIFNDVVGTILDSPALCNKVATRWLLRGDPELCGGLVRIIDSLLGDSLEVEVDAAELVGAEPIRLLFAARKAIGYLFSKPISTASFLLSLMRQAPDASMRSKLGDLLLNPLLLNSRGTLSEYLSRRAESEPAKVQAIVRKTLETLESYIEGLKSVGNIPALHPSLEHRDAYHRRFSEAVTSSFEKARAESALLQLFPQSVLLYGRKAIHHTFGPEGEIRRMETELASHSTNIEIPTIFDPRGLEFVLRVFRHEGLANLMRDCM